MTEFNSNYYSVLGIKQNSSPEKVFAAFRRKTLRATKTNKDYQSYYKPYSVLARPSRKFYDENLDRIKRGQPPLSKYEKTINAVASRAEHQLQSGKAVLDKLRSILRNYPFERSVLGGFGFIFGLSLNFFGISYLLVLLAAVTWMQSFLSFEKKMIGSIILGLLALWTHLIAIRGDRNKTMEKLIKQE